MTTLTTSQLVGEVFFKGSTELRDPQLIGEPFYSPLTFPLTVTQLVGEVFYSARPPGNIYTSAVRLGQDHTTEEGEPVHGDRGAWNTDDYETEHAKDIFDDIHKVHLPEPSVDGHVARDDGTEWLSEFLDHSDLVGVLPDDHHDPVTLDVNADTILSLAAQVLGLDTQTANTIFSGPTAGGAAIPTFRVMVNADLPDPLALKASSTLTIAAGVVTASKSYHLIAAQTGVADDLDTINGGVDRQLLVIQADAGDTITVKHGTGNISLNGATDFELSGDKALLLFWEGSAWVDLGAGGGGGAGGHTIQDEGVNMTARTNLNFVGLGVTVTDDVPNDATVVTIPTDLEWDLVTNGDSVDPGLVFTNGDVIWTTPVE